MDRETLALSSCLACGGNSSELQRWLAEPFSCARDLLSPARQRRARIRSASANALQEILNSGEGERRLQQLRMDGWQMLQPDDNAWPDLLRQIDDAPALLFVHGDPALLSRPQLAMVGARHASTEGLDNAHRFARTLASAGFTITSGLALGIDRAAHEGALQGGTTLAVLGHGPGPCYPPRNQALAKQIINKGGALITEFPPGLPPRPQFFPQRNRLISGLSLATIVVEAAERSGSLITARLAAAQGREVFAIPGSIHNPLSKGCHRLLRDGANWLESVADLLAAFGCLTHVAESALATTAGAAHPLLQYFVSGPNSIDQLQLRSAINISELTRLLSDLELSGDIRRVPGGYARCHDRQELS